MTPGRRIALRLAVAALAASAIVAGAPRLEPRGGLPGLAIGPAVALAASPEPSAAGGDTRSPGEGPGLVGEPFLAILGVVGLGLLTAGGTLLYVRLTSGPDERARDAQDRRPPGSA